MPLATMTRVVLPARLTCPDRPVAPGLTVTGTPKAAATRDGPDLGPNWGRGPPDNQGQQRLATVSRPRRSVGISEHLSRSSKHPDCLSHG